MADGLGCGCAEGRKEGKCSQDLMLKQTIFAKGA